jgi:cytochrome c peroxidase
MRDFGDDESLGFALTDEQVGQFKTPSLRDVARTPPYMHGGQFETLTDVVRFYSDPDPEAGEGHREEIVLTLDLSEAEIGDLVAFLEALDGALPAAEWTTPPSR